MPDVDATILVIDDDPDVRASVGRLLRSLGLEVQLFASIAAFIESDPPDGPTCLVLDVRLPGKGGLDFQRELAAANRELPIIFNDRNHWLSRRLFRHATSGSSLERAVLAAQQCRRSASGLPDMCGACHPCTADAA